MRELSNKVLSYTGSSTPASLMSYKTQTKIKPLIDSDITDINKVSNKTSLMSYKTQTKIKPLIDSDLTDINKVSNKTCNYMLSRDNQLSKINNIS